MQGLAKQMEATREGFLTVMDDDFNTAGALGNLFDLVRAINQTRSDGATSEQLQASQALLRELAGVLGLRLEKSEKQQQAADPFVDLLLEVRAEIRKQKLWPLSDLIRDRLKALGVVIEDSKEGSSWRYEA